MKIKIAVVAALALAAFCGEAAATNWQEAIAAAVQSVAQKLSERAGKTNHVQRLASPENYALLKSTKLKDAAAKLALQKQIAEAALADADENESDRLKWHGIYTRQSVNTNDLTATFYHADGFAVTVKFQRQVVAEEVKAANKRLPRLAVTNGVPARLAEARARRNAEKQEPVVTVSETVEANRR